MNFSSFKYLIPKIKKIDLPGTAAQYKMAPQSRQEELDAIDFDKLNAKKAAVLCLIYPKNQESHIVFILRNVYPGVHSSQIGFPGGSREEQDDSFLATAIRETEEEVGVKEKFIHPVTDLSKLYIPPSNFLVYPFLAFTDETPDFKPDPVEVQQIIEVKLDYLLADESVSSEQISTSYAKNIEVNCFRYQEHVIWGATAMILNELRIILLNLK